MTNSFFSGDWLNMSVFQSAGVEEQAACHFLKKAVESQYITDIIKNRILNCFGWIEY